MTQLWGGRFEGETAPAMRALSRSTHFDLRLVDQDCRVLAAHALAIAGTGALSEQDAETLRACLLGIATDIASGVFPVSDADEDVHTTVERALAERAPSAAGRARAGLSRNDRVATAFRLWTIEHATLVRIGVLDLIGSLRDRATEHRDAMMPGYTHLQRAQVVTLGLTLSAHALALLRDADRILDAVGRTSEMPLGAGALAGTTIPSDRSAAAETLGFDRVASNTIDAVASRDFALEMLAAFAICGVHLSRLSEEIVLWTTTEFGFAELDDAYATGSSLMPQKKNPDVAELTRGKSGRLIGALTGLLAACKGLPLAYNRDLQEDKEPVFDAVDTLLLVLPALSGAVRTMRFNTQRMATAATDPSLLATDLAEALASIVPFADAHEIVGRLVRIAAEKGVGLSDLSPADREQIAPALAGLDWVGLLDSKASAQRRATGPTARSLDEIDRRLAAHASSLNTRG